MAAIANNAPSFAPQRTLPTSRTLMTLTPAALRLRPNPIAKPVPVTGTPFSSHSRRRSFRVFVNVADSSSKTSEYVDGKDLPSMKFLIQAYKKAIINRDEKAIQEIEALICFVEKDKNDLSKKYAEITTEIASGKDKFLCLKADFENFRKQTEKDRLNFTLEIKEDVIATLLAMVDSFEKTKKEMKPETEKEKNIETSYQGIYKQFVEVMRSLGVAVIGTVGKPFDPSMHEAVAREESEQFKAGIVTQEFRRGFVLGNRILRTATVKVSTGSGQTRGNVNQSVEVKSGEDSTASTSSS